MNSTKLWMAAAVCVLFSGMAWAQEPNALTPQEKQDGWQLLFDGHDLKGWHSYLEKGTGSDWSVVDGSIQLKKTNQDPRADFADIVTDGEYTNFDLKLEWKAQPCIDSGVMFYVHESPEYRDTYDTGIEMQIADLACTVPDSRVLMERSGDIFDMISDKVEWVNPAGEWNQFEIIADHGHLQLFQNGHEVIDTQLWDDNWNKLIAGTKVREDAWIQQVPHGTHLAARYRAERRSRSEALVSEYQNQATVIAWRPVAAGFKHSGIGGRHAVPRISANLPSRGRNHLKCGFLIGQRTASNPNRVLSRFDRRLAI